MDRREQGRKRQRSGGTLKEAFTPTHSKSKPWPKSRKCLKAGYMASGFLPCPPGCDMFPSGLSSLPAGTLGSTHLPIYSAKAMSTKDSQVQSPFLLGESVWNPHTGPASCSELRQEKAEEVTVHQEAGAA